MKGFKKNGKFRPTEKRYKPSLSKEKVKSFEDSHAENMKRQLESRKQLLMHKQSIDPEMYECTLCNQQFDKNDPDFDARVNRHIQGRHQHHNVKGERPYQKGEPLSKSGMGGLILGEAKFVPAKEKRKDESIDDYGSDLTEEDKEKIRRMGGTFDDEPKKVNGFQQFKIQIGGEDFLAKRYIAFNPSSGEADDTYTSDTLSGLIDYVRNLAEVSGTLEYDAEQKGKYYYADLLVFDLKKHPKLVKEMKQSWV